VWPFALAIDLGERKSPSSAPDFLETLVEPLSDARTMLADFFSILLMTMAELNRAGRYDRMSDSVERVTGRLAMSAREFVSRHADKFGGRRS